MSKDILKELYWGHVSPWQHGNGPGKEYRELAKIIGTHRDYFTKEMSKKDRIRFDEFETLFSRISNLEQGSAFANGFKLATQLMIAALQEND